MIKITGTPGARFLLTLTNQADVSKLTSNAPGYNITLKHVDTAIPKSGVYSFTQLFPPTTASAKYKIKVISRHDTTLGPNIKNYILLNQWYPTTLTLTLASAGSASDFDSHGSNYGVTNVTIKKPVDVERDGNVIESKNKQLIIETTDLSWEIKGASGGAITISRQPVATDWSNNIANTDDDSNTKVVVRAISDAESGRIKLSSADADKLTTNMVVKLEERGEDELKRILSDIEEEVLEEDIREEEADSDVDADVDYEEEDAPEDVVTEDTELESGATTVKEVTSSAVDTTNDFVTLSTHQRIRYGDTLRFTNGGTVVVFEQLKAVQLAPSVIKITATIHPLTMGVSDVTSTLALDNFITT